VLPKARRVLFWNIAMLKKTTLALCIGATFAISACKIVKTAPEGDANAAAQSGEAGDDARIAALLDKTYETELLPLIASRALPVADLRTALADGLEAAGAAHGNRGSGEGAAWNFAVKGEGRVIEANLTSRARKAMLDTDGDGTADLTLQLGPVIKGTSLRDVAPFYRFGDFRDQIEFAKLGRALNDRTSSALVVPEGDLVGKTLSFTGTVDLKSATDPWLVTTVTLADAP
jgi:predicted lipoprotein